MQIMERYQSTKNEQHSIHLSTGIAMFVKRYDKVVSRLPLFEGQNINAKAPLKFK